MKSLVPLAAAALACAGCIPFTAYTSPGVDGEIIDGTSGAAVPAATIVVHAGFHQPYDGPVTTVTSDTDGHFLPPQRSRRIWLPPLPFDLASPDALLSVSAAGYEPQEQTFFSLLEAQPGARRVVIRLQHQ